MQQVFFTPVQFLVGLWQSSFICFIYAIRIIISGQKKNFGNQGDDFINNIDFMNSKTPISTG